jgi:hypothetical protein
VTCAAWTDTTTETALHCCQTATGSCNTTQTLRNISCVMLYRCQYKWGEHTRWPLHHDHFWSILCPHLLYSTSSHVLLTKYSLIIVAWFHKNDYLSNNIWIKLKPHTHKGCVRLFLLPYCASHKELNSHHPHSPMWVEDIHTMGCCSMPQRHCLRHCNHHHSAVQPSALCLTPWLGCTWVPFAAQGCYPSPRRGCLGLDTGGGVVL